MRHKIWYFGIFCIKNTKIMILCKTTRMGLFTNAGEHCTQKVFWRIIMKKVFKVIFIFAMAVLVARGVYSQADLVSQNPQLDFYINVIPKQKNITISGGSNWDGRLVIDDKYKVTYSHNDSYTTDGFNSIKESYSSYGVKVPGENFSLNFDGVGFIVWENGKMQIKLSINGYGNRSYKTATMPGPNSTAGIRNVREYNSSGRSSFNITLDLEAEYSNGRFSSKLRITPQRTVTLDLTGDQNVSKSIKIGSNNWISPNIVSKTASELNASSKDVFGDWTWNEDRSKIFLKSMMSDNKFVIWNQDGTISWSMEMGKNTKGVSDTTTETNDRIVNLSMSFDGAVAQVFSFIENKEATPPQNFIQLDYGVYNRFLGQLDKKSDVILNQIKDKSMLILQYKDDRTDKTDMFMLEGLETIIEYLNE